MVHPDSQVGESWLCSEHLLTAAINAKTEGGSLARTWFDRLAAIRDTTANDDLSF
jgi:hypothetical protein